MVFHSPLCWFACYGEIFCVKCEVYLPNQVNETESKGKIAKDSVGMASLRFDYISWLLYLPVRPETF